MYDYAMETALRFAEANGGTLRTNVGPLPLKVAVVKRDGHREQIEVPFGDWRIDREFWEQTQSKFGSKYPKAMAKVAEQVAKFKIA